MQQKDPEIEFLDLFKDTDDFLHDLNPRKYNPPFMTTVFGPMRKSVFQNIQKKWPGDKEKLAYFISKFEVEYIEVLRSKLREHYIDFILQKNYEIPEEINMQEVQNYGAVSELAQISIAVAEWTLELEISAYTLEGLELYGLIEPQEKKHEDYLDLLKKEYSYKKKSTFAATSEYLVRRIINFTCGKVASLALAKGMSKGGFQGKDILDIVLSISTSSEIPWKAIASTLNLTWVVGGFVVSHFCQKLNDYAVKKEVFSHMSHVQEVFESNKLHLMTERKTIMDLVEKAVSEEDSTKYKWELEVLVRTVQDVLKPPVVEKHGEGSTLEHLLHHDEKNKTFKVKEEEDVVVVEEKGFQEQVDDSGVVVVEW